MASTFNVSKITTFYANSSQNSTGEISIGKEDIESGPSESNVEIADTVTDPDGGTIFTVSRMTFTIAIADYDFGFVDTLNSGNTLETEMVNRSIVYYRFDLEGGTILDSAGNQYIPFRANVRPGMDIGTDDDLVSTVIEGTHSDHGGVQAL